MRLTNNFFALLVGMVTGGLVLIFFPLMSEDVALSNYWVAALLTSICVGTPCGAVAGLLALDSMRYYSDIDDFAWTIDLSKFKMPFIGIRDGKFYTGSVFTHSVGIPVIFLGTPLILAIAGVQSSVVVPFLIVGAVLALGLGILSSPLLMNWVSYGDRGEILLYFPLPSFKRKPAYKQVDKGHTEEFYYAMLREASTTGDIERENYALEKLGLYKAPPVPAGEDDLSFHTPKIEPSMSVTSSALRELSDSVKAMLYSNEPMPAELEGVTIRSVISDRDKTTFKTIEKGDIVIPNVSKTKKKGKKI